MRFKLLFTLIPLLAGSFVVAGFIAVNISRSQLIEASGELLRYKSELLLKFSHSQWSNLAESDFSDDPTYIDVVRRSIELYAADMISQDSEVIFSVNADGDLDFSTKDIEFTAEDLAALSTSPRTVSGLSDYRIDGTRYFGLSVHDGCPSCTYYVVISEGQFSEKIRSMTLFQVLTFVVSLLVIIVSLVLTISMLVRPIQYISESARSIAEDKDLSRQIDVEYSDEIGQLAFEFNNMTSSLDLAIRKLKKKALDEAVAKKSVLTREIEALEVLGNAANFKDSETGAHIVRVSRYSVLLSRLIGHSEDLQDLILLASPLHDIGKLGIPDSILQKPGPLTTEEMRIIYTHTNIGYEILRNPSSRYLKAGAVIALSHHEKFDGTGYPHGLVGEDIPIFGRIVSIADVFDAVTSKRPYKEAWNFKDAVEYLQSQRGRHFDPELIDLFMANIDEVRDIFEATESRN